MSGHRTFIVLAFVFSVGLRASGGQSGAAANPCVQGGNRTPRLLPMDEAPSKPEFVRYRAQLQGAVERRDIDAVIDAADPGIRLGFDASGGTAALRKLFSDRSESWEEFSSVLRLGGSFNSSTSFAAPYVYSRWPEQFDSFECAAITGRNVRLRASPQLDAPVITLVTYSIVQLLERADDRGVWSRVRLGDGGTGYVWHAYIRSPIDHRALFNMSDGRWRMTAFVAGD